MSVTRCLEAGTELVDNPVLLGHVNLGTTPISAPLGEDRTAGVVTRPRGRVIMDTMDDMPRSYRDLIAPMVATTRGLLAAGEDLAPIALVGNLSTGEMQLVTIDPNSPEPKDDLAASIRFAAATLRADFIFMVMDAWALAAEQAHRHEEIIARYGSFGDSPYRIDVVNFSLETPRGTWMAIAPIEAGEGGARTFAEPEFRRYPLAEGRFVGLLPANNGDDTPPALH